VSVIRSLVALGLAATALLGACPPGHAERLAIGEGVYWAAADGEPTLPTHLRTDMARAGTTLTGVEFLLDEVEIRIRAEDVIERSTEILYFPSSESAAEYGNRELSFRAGSDELTILEAMVIDSDGRPTRIDPATVQIVPESTDGVFSDSRYAVLPLAGLGAGSKAIIISERQTDRASLHTEWNRILFPQTFLPRQLFRLRVSWSKPGLEPSRKLAMEGLQCEDVSSLELLCEATEIPAYPSDPDVLYRDVLPQIVLAEPASWDDIANRFTRYVGRAIDSSPEVVGHARELVAGLESDTKRLEAVHRFVAQEIRYVGLEHEERGYVPDGTTLTLRRRYGDCKDMTVLAIDLLRSVGIEANAVLVATERHDPEALMLPASGYFDHMIACGQLSDGSSFCLDPTDAYTDATSISPWIQGAVALPLEADTAPVRLPNDRYRWRLREDMHLHVTAAGDLREEGRLAYRGPYASWMRSQLARLSHEERIEWTIQDYQATVSDLVTPDFRLENVDQPEEELATEWSASYTGLIETGSELAYAEDSPWLDQLISFFGSQNEHHAYQFPGFSYTGMISVEVDERWQVIGNRREIRLDSEFGRLDRRVTLHDDGLTIRTEVQLPAATIPVDKLPKFSEFLRILDRENGWRLRATDPAE